MKAASKYPRFARLAARLIIGVIAGIFFPAIKLFPKTFATIFALTLAADAASFGEVFMPRAGALLGEAEYINQIVIG